MPDHTEKQDLQLDVTSNVTETIFDGLRECIMQHCEEVQDLADDIHKLNQKWWKRGEDGKPIRNKGEAIALMHSELSEALEGLRKDRQDDHLPEFKNEVVELADCVIRILDYCAGFKLPIGDAIFEKLKYNASRADHKLENRMKDGGKKF